MNNRLSGAWTLFLPALLLGLAGIGAGGCDQEDAAGPFDDTAVAAENEALDGGAGMGPFARLTAESIDSRLQLNDEQEEAVGAALERARETKRDRLSRLTRGEGRRGARWGRPALGPAAGDPPSFVFLEEVSKVLTADQFVQLAQMLTEQRDAWAVERRAGADRNQGREGRPHRGSHGRSGRHAGSGPGLLDGPLGERAARYLDLTDDQRERIRGIFEERADQMREIRTSSAPGELRDPATRERLRTMRTETREEIKGILTTEQWEKVEAFRSSRVAEHVDARLERMEDQLSRRAAFLERVLELDPDQAGAVRDLLTASVSDRTAMLTGLKSGTVAPEDALSATLELEKGIADEIAGLLTPEQRARFDALRDLLPPHGRGPRF